MSQNNFKLLKDIAFIRNNSAIRKNTEVSDEFKKKYSYVTFRDIPSSGFLSTVNEEREAHYSLVEMNTLRENDILIATNGKIRKIAIIGIPAKTLIASAAFTLIRMNVKSDAVPMYMHLKEYITNGKFKSIIKTSSTGIENININDLKNLKISVLTDKDKTDLNNTFYKKVNY